ncbi:MAG: hypothetical protein HQM12_08965 [SAR324 cluster bacterium]|nr:hypothetical protein [SAR324 cluster bacterium]MBF0350289.1 hypothetical protein [SAR324 cluster bacterium]
MQESQRSYYCYLNHGQAMVQEIPPENFEDLPGHYMTRCPTTQIARMVYDAELRIRKWRFQG